MRPRTVDPFGLLQSALEVYREHFAVLFPLALIVGLIQAILTQAFGAPTADEPSTAALVGTMLSLIPTVVFLSFTVELQRDVHAGRELRSTGELMSAVLPITLPLLALALVLSLMIVLGVFLLIVPGVVLATIWAVALQAYVVERPSLLASLGRSRELVRGHGWPVLGAVVLILLVTLIGAIVATIISVDPTSAVGSLIQLVIASLITPVTVLTAGALYFRLVDLQGPVVDATTPGAERDPAYDAFGNRD
jgi:hypothetical protein